MTSYTYKARDAIGRSIEETLEADTQEEAVKQVLAKGYSIVSIRQQAAFREKIKQFIRRFRSNKISEYDVVLFARQMTVMIRGGLPLVESLESIKEQLTSERFKFIVDEIIIDVKSGKAISAAIARHPKVFSELFVNMVRVGEAAGILDSILERIADIGEQSLDVKTRIRGALVYPVILLSVAILVVLFLMIGIVPKFTTVFESYDAKLPISTVLLLTTSALLQKLWYVFIVVGGGSFFFLKKYFSSPEGKFKLHDFLLHLPLFGVFYTKLAIARLCRTLGVLIGSGVPLLKAMEITRNTVDNVVLKKTIEKIIEGIAEGKSMTDQFRRSGLFPQFVVQMVALGENSGKLDESLEQIATHYDSQTEQAIKNFTTAFEPITLVFMGGIVAYIALSILLPIFNLVKVLRGN